MPPSKLSHLHDIVSLLQSMASESNRLGMSRFGINVDRALGIKVTDLRKLARRIEKSHDLALELWETGIHEARLLATMIDIPVEVTEEQMEGWAADLDSWDTVDQACNNLFHKTSLAHKKAVQWSSRKEEYIKRAGFSLMAALTVHDRASEDTVFIGYLEHVLSAADDERNYVRKAVNWVLRQIGKRNQSLWKRALETASLLEDTDSKNSRWIARDARRELVRVGIERGWG